MANHIKKGNLLQAKYKDDNYSHAHRVPQFAIYAITSSFYKQ